MHSTQAIHLFNIQSIFYNEISCKILILWNEKAGCACSVAQSRLTLCDPMGCSQPGSSVHGILQQEYWSGLPFPSPAERWEAGGKGKVIKTWGFNMSLASAMPSQFNLHNCLRIQRSLSLIKRSFKQFVQSNELLKQQIWYPNRPGLFTYTQMHPG